jgi:hypothetical protein
MRLVPWRMAWSTTLTLPSAWAAWAGLHGHFQGLTEPEEAALAEILLELVFGPVDLGLQVGLVAMQGRGAEIILLAKGGQGGGPGD